MKIILLFLYILGSWQVSAQLVQDFRIGYSYSINKYEDQLDPNQSMQKLKSGGKMLSYQAHYVFDSVFFLGVRALIQKQNCAIVYNDDYYKHSMPDNDYYNSYSHFVGKEYNRMDQSYFMVGPVLGLTKKLSPNFLVSGAVSFLIYDNRQRVKTFEENLVQQEFRTHFYHTWGNDIYTYRQESEFLNGWNMKYTFCLSISSALFKSKRHQLLFNIEAGKAIKQNYSLVFRTNQVNTATESNALRVRNYGTYFGISLGYSYTLNFKKK